METATITREYQVLKPTYTVPLTDFNIEPAPLKRAHIVTLVQAGANASPKALLDGLVKVKDEVVTKLKRCGLMTFSTTACNLAFCGTICCGWAISKF